LEHTDFAQNLKKCNELGNAADSRWQLISQSGGVNSIPHPDY